MSDFAKDTNVPTNDCISRQTAIDAVEKESQVDGAYGYMDTKSIVDLLSDLPSAEPKRGRWIFARYYVWECSECGKNPTRGMGYTQSGSELFRYCPNCGASMEVTE